MSKQPKRSVARSKSGRQRRQRHVLTDPRRASRKANGEKAIPGRWSHRVMETSDAMDIEADIFKTGSAESIAESLKRSSTRSRRRKSTPFQSAMSMLNFYINRAGRNLPKTRRSTLKQAKRELRVAFGRTP